MQAWLNELPVLNQPPKLWVERLAIYRSIDPVEIVRDVSLRQGINIIWAHEPGAASGHTGRHAMGHGVGKTSFCLLLRYCLGDDAKAIHDLRDEVRAHFPEGGVGAVVHLGGNIWSVFRPFALYRDSIAARTTTIEALFGDMECVPFKDYEIELEEFMLSGVSPRIVPETGQTIRWKHLLAWLTRDQEARFSNFYHWREGEGSGLQRARQDPPLVVQAVLGLLDNGESSAMNGIRVLEQQMQEAQDRATQMRQEPDLIRKRFETELRAWLRVDSVVPMRPNDLFKDSVESLLVQRKRSAIQRMLALGAQIVSLDIQLAELRDEELRANRSYERWDNELKLVEAALNRDEKAYRRLANRRTELLDLVGPCEPGGVPFQDCSHIKQRIATISFQEKRDQAATQASVRQWEIEKSAATKERNLADVFRRRVRESIQSKQRERGHLQTKCNTEELDQERGTQLLEDFSRWESLESSPELAIKLSEAEANRKNIETSLNSARTALLVLQTTKSVREKQLAERMGQLAQMLLGDDAFGTFNKFDELRPFHLSVRGGLAYHVLEVLLGDWICLLDAVSGGSSFPPFVMHDCPREADMSQPLYEELLKLTLRLEQHLAGNTGAPFQYILTTTTAPPEVLQGEPFVRLELVPSDESRYLFGKRLQVQSDGLERSANG